MYNNITTVCHLVNDPELRETPSGKKVCSMRVCVSEKDARDKAYIDAELWEKQAETAAQYLKKGREVLLIGALCMSTWENEGQKRSKHYIKVREFKFLNTGGGKKEEGADKEAVPAGDTGGDDDVPF